MGIPKCTTEHGNDINNVNPVHAFKTCHGWHLLAKLKEIFRGKRALISIKINNDITKARVEKHSHEICIIDQNNTRLMCDIEKLLFMGNSVHIQE